MSEDNLRFAAGMALVALMVCSLVSIWTDLVAGGDGRPWLYAAGTCALAAVILLACIDRKKP